jgi:hypothetical protein
LATKDRLGDLQMLTRMVSARFLVREDKEAIGQTATGIVI